MKEEFICGKPAAFSYIWPGNTVAYICIDCVPQLQAVARAMGFPLAAMPTFGPHGHTCAQHVLREVEEPQTMAFSQVSDPEDFTPSGGSISLPEPEPVLVGGGGTFDGGGASSSWDPGPSASDSGSSDSGSCNPDTGSSSSDSSSSFDP